MPLSTPKWKNAARCLKNTAPNAVYAGLGKVLRYNEKIFTDEVLHELV